MSPPDSEREKGYYFGAGRVVNGIGAGKGPKSRAEVATGRIGAGKGLKFRAEWVVNGIGAGKVVLFWRRMGGVRNWRGKRVKIPRGVGLEMVPWRGRRGTSTSLAK